MSKHIHACFYRPLSSEMLELNFEQIAADRTGSVSGKACRTRACSQKLHTSTHLEFLLKVFQVLAENFLKQNGPEKEVQRCTRPCERETAHNLDTSLGWGGGGGS
jgi:hypothetical protein